MVKKIDAAPIKAGKAIRLIAASKFKTLSTQVDNYEKQIEKPATSKAELIREYADKHHLNNRAYGMIRSLQKLGEKDSEKLADVLASFDIMRGFAKLDDTANIQGRMFGSGVEETEPEKDDDKRDFRPRALRTGTGIDGEQLAEHMANEGKGSDGKGGPKKRTAKEAADAAEAAAKNGDNVTKLH